MRRPLSVVTSNGNAEAAFDVLGWRCAGREDQWGGFMNLLDSDASIGERPGQYPRRKGVGIRGLTVDRPRSSFQVRRNPSTLWEAPTVTFVMVEVASVFYGREMPKGPFDG